MTNTNASHKHFPKLDGRGTHCSISKEAAWKKCTDNAFAQSCGTDLRPSCSRSCCASATTPLEPSGRVRRCGAILIALKWWHHSHFAISRLPKNIDGKNITGFNLSDSAALCCQASSLSVADLRMLHMRVVNKKQYCALGILNPHPEFLSPRFSTSWFSAPT